MISSLCPTGMDTLDMAFFFKAINKLIKFDATILLKKANKVYQQ